MDFSDVYLDNLFTKFQSIKEVYTATTFKLKRRKVVPRDQSAVVMGKEKSMNFTDIPFSFNELVIGSPIVHGKFINMILT